MKLIPILGASLIVAGTLTFAAVKAIGPQEQEMPQPTQEHKELMKFVGHFEGFVTMFTEEGERTAPASETITAHGPFWTQSHFKMAMGGGMYYEGHGCQGYDPVKKHYTTTWIDNMKPTMSLMTGTRDPETGVITMNWMDSSPDDPTKMVPHRFENSFGEDSYTMNFFVDGVNTMRIDMTRKADAVEASHGDHGAHDAGDGHDHDHDGDDHDH